VVAYKEVASGSTISVTATLTTVLILNNNIPGAPATATLPNTNSVPDGTMIITTSTDLQGFRVNNSPLQSSLQSIIWVNTSNGWKRNSIA